MALAGTVVGVVVVFVVKYKAGISFEFLVWPSSSPSSSSSSPSLSPSRVLVDCDDDGEMATMLSI